MNVEIKLGMNGMELECDQYTIGKLFTLESTLNQLSTEFYRQNYDKKNATCFSFDGQKTS